MVRHLVSVTLTIPRKWVWLHLLVAVAHTLGWIQPERRNKKGRSHRANYSTAVLLYNQM